MTVSSSGAALALERVIGLTTLHNAALSSHSSSGEVAYAAGCVVVLYHPKKNKQTRYFRAAKPISSISFSQNGKYLAVGERGLRPAVIVWEIKTGQVLAELKGHKYGITSLAWSPDSSFLVSIGFKFDKQIILWQNMAQLSKGNEDYLDMKECGKVKVVNRVHAVKFSRDGRSFVTCGDKQVKWWKLPQSNTSSPEPGAPNPPNTSNQIMPPPPPSQKKNDLNKVNSNEDVTNTAVSKKVVVPELKGKDATIVESHRDASFVDVACGAGGKCFALTSGGVLCLFDEKMCSLTSFVSLEASNGYCISLQEPYGGNGSESGSEDEQHAIIAVGCSDGLIRVFDSFNLRYLATLPQPPPAGYLNFKSVDELSKLTNLHHDANESYENQQQLNEEVGRNSPSSEYKPPTLKYPACIALKWLNKSQQVSSSQLNNQVVPVPPTHLVAIYGDRSLFVWDISKSSNTQQYSSTLNHAPIHQDELVIGKYRSSQNHSSCIWDVRPMPSSFGPGYGSMFFSCAADNTVRLWCIDSNQAQSHQNTQRSQTSNNDQASVNTAQTGAAAASSSSSSSPKVMNFFSKELVHTFSCSPLTPNTQPAQVDEAAQEELKRQLYIEEKYNIPPPSNMGNTVLIDGEYDLDSPCKVDHPSQSGCPRVLAISPNGDEIACGDRIGNLRIWSLKNQSFGATSMIDSEVGTRKSLYELVFSATAHDAEVLCLDYTFQHEVNQSNQKAVADTYSVDGTSKPSSGDSEGSGGASGSGWMSVLLASGGRDRLIHILGASQERCYEKKCDVKKDDDSIVAPASYELLQTLEHHESAVTSLKFSNNGKKLFSIGAEGSLSLCKVNPKPVSASHQSSEEGSEATSKMMGSLLDSIDTMIPKRIHRFRSVPLIHGVSYDVGSDVTGKYVVCAGQTDSKLHIYSASSGKHLRSYSADPSDLNDEMGNDISAKKGKRSVASELYKIDLCPAGMYLATCSFDRWIRLIDFYSGQVIAQVSGHAELVTSLRFSLDGKRLISSGGDGCVFIWKLNGQITSAMNDRIAELKHMEEVKQRKSKDEGAVTAPPQQQLVQQSESNSNREAATSDESATATPSSAIIVRKESGEIEAEYLPSPPDVREVRLTGSTHQTLFKPSDELREGGGDMTPPRNQSPLVRNEQDKAPAAAAPPAVAVATNQEEEEIGESSNATNAQGRVLQGKWAESVQASGGGYDVLGKYHVTPPLENSVNESSETSVQQTILQKQSSEDIDTEDVDEKLKTMFSTTTHFKDEDEMKDEDELMKSVEEEDGVMVAESPRHAAVSDNHDGESDRPFSFGDHENSTSDEEEGNKEQDDNDDDDTTSDGDTSISDDSDDDQSKNDGEKATEKEEGAVEEDGEEVNHGDTWLGDEVRSSWKSIDIDAILSKPKELLDPTSARDTIEPLSNDDVAKANKTSEDLDVDNGSPASSIDILSFSASFRRSTSSVSNPLSNSELSSTLKSQKKKKSKHSSKIKSTSSDASVAVDSGNRGEIAFESPPRNRTVTPISKEEEEVLLGSNSNNVPSSTTGTPSKSHVQPPNSAGGGFSTPSKESRRKPAASFDSHNHGGGGGVSSSLASRGSTASSRTLGEERERLRSRDKRRDTASALAAMNDSLLKMGILKRPPSSESSSMKNNTSSKVPATNHVASSMPVLQNGNASNMDDDAGISHRPSTADPAAVAGTRNRHRVGSSGSGGYISPDESLSPLQSLELHREEENYFRSSLTVSVTSEEHEEVDIETSTNDHMDKATGKSASLDPNMSIDSVQSSMASLPRPLSEYRMSLQRLQEAVVETARLYQELQQHTVVGIQQPSSPVKNSKSPSIPGTPEQRTDDNSGKCTLSAAEPSPMKIGLPNMVVSPTREASSNSRRRSNADSPSSGDVENGGDALDLLGEFAATWESVGGLVAHSQSLHSSNPAVGSSMSSLSSDSLGSFSSFSLNQPFLINAPMSVSTSNSSHPFSNNGPAVGLPPILERGESAVDGLNNNNNAKSPSNSGGDGATAGDNLRRTAMVSPPSRPAPPPPKQSSPSRENDIKSKSNQEAAVAAAAQQLMSPTFDGQFQEPNSSKDVPSSSSSQSRAGGESSSSSFSSALGGLGEPSPEVSIILEKYSDVLLGMVQQKLQLSQSGTSLTANLKTSPEKHDVDTQPPSS